MGKRMKYVFLVSHGELAHGMHTALEMFSGENREDILSVGLKNGMGADAFANQVRETLSVVKPEDEILLFADLVGGSPLTNAANVVAEMGLLEKTVMCGGNESASRIKRRHHEGHDGGRGAARFHHAGSKGRSAAVLCGGGRRRGRYLIRKRVKGG